MLSWVPASSIVVIFTRSIRGHRCSDGTTLPFLNALGRRSVDTKRRGDGAVEPVKNQSDLVNLNPVPRSRREVDNRICRIFKPSANVMQSGEANSRSWLLTFDTRDRWQSPLVGWGASCDAVSGVELAFDSKEHAVDYCEKMGFKYWIDRPNISRPKIKSYGDNFSWSKRTRLDNK
ncbi:hypothetical protein ACOME3_002572 [Neoechinorhynchus agilis]